MALYAYIVGEIVLCTSHEVVFCVKLPPVACCAEFTSLRFLNSERDGLTVKSSNIPLLELSQ